MSRSVPGLEVLGRDWDGLSQYPSNARQEDSCNHRHSSNELQDDSSSAIHYTLHLHTALELTISVSTSKLLGLHWKDSWRVKWDLIYQTR
jgi:hypothetical protein